MTHFQLQYNHRLKSSLRKNIFVEFSDTLVMPSVKWTWENTIYDEHALNGLNKYIYFFCRLPPSEKNKIIIIKVPHIYTQ